MNAPLNLSCSKLQRSRGLTNQIVFYLFQDLKTHWPKVLSFNFSLALLQMQYVLVLWHRKLDIDESIER